MRAVLVFLLLSAGLTGTAQGQTPLDTGTPEAAFTGGPVRLSKAAANRLREHYHGDKVPIIPQPFRTRLDLALIGGDANRLEDARQALIKANGMETALLWEQSRFVATGGPAVAALHARDLAALGSSGVTETAAMLWLYAAAVTFTDGHQCTDPAAPDAWMEALRGPAYDPVARIIRTLPEDRLAAMRDLAVRLEAAMAGDRNSLALCRLKGAVAEVRPDPEWRVDAAKSRANLPKYLALISSLARPVAQAKP